MGTVAKLAMRQPFVLFKGLTFQKLCLPLVIDSTGLKVFGEGEWKVKKHGKERRWYLVSGIWYLVSGIWYLVSGIWYLVLPG
ncbi:hypothetical protein [Klebsiella pneumoniae]|uniref:hypothetical protein n=1 Tax=Klebsiella pneumoniae TaxID=573 RepID=UPI0020109BE1|nr:hypothetical protein [Klebsiella pneumoniae]UPZ02733.1 hypothetical protein MOV22_26920 [Klebsiella pneumoniae]